MFEKTKTRIEEKINQPIRVNSVIAIGAMIVAVIALIFAVRR
jgi:hypothetical protein